MVQWKRWAAGALGALHLTWMWTAPLPTVVLWSGAVPALLPLVWMVSMSTIGYPAFSVLSGVHALLCLAKGEMLGMGSAVALAVSAALWRLATFDGRKVKQVGHTMTFPAFPLSYLLCRPQAVPPNAGRVLSPLRTASPKCLVVIVNPAAGSGESLAAFKKAEEVFRAADIDLVVSQTDRSGQATDIARTASMEGVDGVVAVGGDGTLSEVLNGLAARPADQRRPLGVIPGGTCNNFATDLGLLSPTIAAQRIVAGKVGGIDAVHVTHGLTDEQQKKKMPSSTWGLNTVAWGVGLRTVQLAEKLAFLGPAKFDVGGLLSILTFNPVEVTTTMRRGKESWTSKGKYVIAMTQVCQRAGNGFRFGPFAKLDDGLMDTCMLKKIGVLRTIELFDEVKREGSHVFAYDTEYHQWEEQHFETSEPTAISVDGEDTGITPMTIKAVQQAFECFV